MARPKGSKNKKSKMGRPTLFNSAEELQALIDKYFKESVPESYVGKDGEVHTIFKAPTITGLAYALGFESRQSLYDYEMRDDFSYTIKRARLRIENQYETNLSDPRVKPAGSIFALKNVGQWKDKQEVTVADDGQLKEFAQILKDMK